MHLRYLLLLILLVVVIVSPTMAYEYSITYIEDYLYSSAPYPCNVNDLTPWGRLESSKVKYWLGEKAGWTERFCHDNATVTKEDFGTIDTGYQGLDEADFHFHLGHGYRNPITGGTWLALWNYSPCFNPGAIVTPDDVYKKWGDYDNEWVFLHSCYVLSEVSRWGGALKYSHMILGFSTVSYTNDTLIDLFFKSAIDWDWTIVQAYYLRNKDDIR